MNCFAGCPCSHSILQSYASVDHGFIGVFSSINRMSLCAFGIRLIDNASFLFFWGDCGKDEDSRVQPGC